MNHDVLIKYDTTALNADFPQSEDEISDSVIYYNWLNRIFKFW